MSEKYQLFDRNVEDNNDKIERKFELYNINSFYECDNPEGAMRAQQLQGASYVDEGYVYESALDSYGRLMPELDRSRGDNVKYFLAAPKDSASGEDYHAAVRVVDIPEGGSIDDLAAYRYSQHVISPDVDDFLRDMSLDESAPSVREICALSKDSNANSMASFELVRHLLQEGINNKTDELWIVTFTEFAYKSIERNFSENVFYKLGEKIKIDVGDDRTSDELLLVPVLVQPCMVMDQVADRILAEDDDKLRRRYTNTLMFISDGVKDEMITPKVKSIIEGQV